MVLTQDFQDPDDAETKLLKWTYFNDGKHHAESKNNINVLGN